MFLLLLIVFLKIVFLKIVFLKIVFLKIVSQALRRQRIQRKEMMRSVAPTATESPFSIRRAKSKRGGTCIGHLTKNKVGPKAHLAAVIVSSCRLSAARKALSEVSAVLENGEQSLSQFVPSVQRDAIILTRIVRSQSFGFRPQQHHRSILAVHRLPSFSYVAVIRRKIGLHGGSGTQDSFDSFSTAHYPPRRPAHRTQLLQLAFHTRSHQIRSCGKGSNAAIDGKGSHHRLRSAPLL